ncbi:Hypothetical predicted protein [Xyrichtys novacula]|uniref:Uncharacterized protein n=1 Tax=Xyrichtys novacula TaxID=13765 RepID=A0AAV1FMT3_XYRNO|nr:Hypothetical predicted protein [Xyrichtys novacula]
MGVLPCDHSPRGTAASLHWKLHCVSSYLCGSGLFAFAFGELHRSPPLSVRLCEAQRCLNWWMINSTYRRTHVYDPEVANVPHI